MNTAETSHVDPQTATAASGPLRWDLTWDYLRRKRAVVEAGHDAEIAWQRCCIGPVTATTLFREAVWVILSAGMRESVVRSVFPSLCVALYQFDPAEVAAHVSCRDDAFRAFGHAKKIDAIIACAQIITAMPEAAIRTRLNADPEAFLRSLPYIGPVTWRHLAKNLGFSVAKPDRHLQRLADQAGLTVDELCWQISFQVGDPVQVVDLVLWRSCTLNQLSATTNQGTRW